MNNLFIIDNLLKQNESERLEFKTHYNGTIAAKHITAMLNAKGGDVVFGVTDNKEVVGVNPRVDVQKIQIQLLTAIRPTAPINISEIDYNGKQVILISVWEGSQKPYMCGGKIYQRIADGTREREALKPDVDQMILERSLTESNWERQSVLNVEMEDLDLEELHATKQAFQQQLEIKELSDEEFLLRSGLIQNGDLTNACVVLYAKNPVQYIPQISVRLSVYKSDNLADLVDTKLFENNLFKNIDAIFQYFDATYAKTLRIDGPVREEKWNYPRIAVREGIMNALVHKDYSRPSAITNVRIFPTKLEIQNTGDLLTAISFAEMERNSYSVLRNPDIAHQCYYRGLIEMMGTGIARIKQDCRSNNFAIPVFSEEKGIIQVVFPNLEHKIVSHKEDPDFTTIVNQILYTYSIDVKEKLIAVLNILQTQPGTRISALKELIDIPEKTLERHVKILKEAGLVEYKGAKKSGGYYIVKDRIANGEGINGGINEGINEGINNAPRK